MASEPDNLVLEILRRMQGDLSSLKGDMSSLKSDAAEMKDDIAGIKRIQDDHTVRLVFLADEMMLLRTATVGLLRDAEEARVDRGNHKNWMRDLEHRVERLEGAH